MSMGNFAATAHSTGFSPRADIGMMCVRMCARTCMLHVCEQGECMPLRVSEAAAEDNDTRW